MADKVLSTITVQGLDDIPDGTYVNNPESTAGQFSASKAYVIGDHVFYNRKLYKFTSAHAAGAWNAAHVSEVAIGDEIKALDGDVAGLKNDLTHNNLANAFDGNLFNGYWNGSGVLTPINNIDVCCASKIPCPENANVVLITNTDVTDYIIYISYYDEAGTTRIKRDTASSARYEGTAPAGTHWFAFTYEKSGINKDTFGTVQLYINNSIDALTAHLDSMITATVEDVGKALLAKTVTNGKVTEWEFGETGGSDDVAYEIGTQLKATKTINGYKLDSNGYLSSNDASAFTVKKYLVVPGETVYLKLSADGETICNFQTTDVNPSSSSGNIVETIHDSLDGYYKVPETANFIIVCQLQANTANMVCTATTVQTGIMEEVSDLLDIQDVVYASADLSESNYLNGGAYDNLVFLSYVPITDAGYIKVVWQDNRTQYSVVPVKFVVCKLIGTYYRIVDTFTAQSVPYRTNVYQSECYVDGNETYYIGIYGIHGSNMSLYTYGWGTSEYAFSSADDLTVGTEFLKGYNYTNQSIAMYPVITSVNYGIHKDLGKINDAVFGSAVNGNDKYAHFSVDDCVFWTNLIANEETYNSAFDEPHLALYKSIHDIYGFCITLNVFCVSGDYLIENVPSKFATDFKNNAEWLKFAYHAEDANTYLSNLTTEAATASYNKFANAIYTMTGTTDCIDRIARLGFYDGNLANCLAIRDANCGIVGLLCADDARDSYYLGETLSIFVRTHAMYRDSTNQLVFLNTVKRLESLTLTEAAQLLTPANGNINRYVEFFTHESSNDRFTAIVAWAVDNGYKFGFMQDILKV